MQHRKNEHIGMVAVCKNYTAGNCSFSADACWWSHANPQDNGSKSISCFICNKSFESKIDMMKHRKRNHKNIVKQCEKFEQKCCSFTNKSCWYLHDQENENDLETKSVFSEGDRKSKTTISEASQEAENRLMNLRKNVKITTK